MIKPANFILDLLRTYGHKGTSARNLMVSSQMFNFSENLIRVTLSRLVARGLVDNFKRGHYRLAELSDPVAEFIEEWRLGESRRRPWKQGSFLMVQLSSTTKRDGWVLTSTGFRELQPGFWLRPDNLRRRGEALFNWLHQLGLSVQAITGEHLVLPERQYRLLIDHYDISRLNKRYLQLISTLEQSTRRLETGSTRMAMTESFTLGGEALHALAKDPYLPDELQEPGHREQLWQAMLQYDTLGRQVWSKTDSSMPTSIISYT